MNSVCDKEGSENERDWAGRGVDSVRHCIDLALDERHAVFTKGFRSDKIDKPGFVEPPF